jgi:Lon protease-like protein
LFVSRLPLFPLSHGLFPDGRLQLQIFEVRYLDLMRRCHQEGSAFGVVWLSEGDEVQKPGQIPSVYSWGCLAHITELITVQPALLRVSCRGGLRFSLDGVEAGPYGVWHAETATVDADLAVEIPDDLQGLSNRLGQWIASAQSKGFEDHLPMERPYRLDECGWVANRWAELLSLPAERKVELMAELDPVRRLSAIKACLDLS